MSCARLRQQCYFCQVFSAKIGNGRSLPCKKCGPCIGCRRRKPYGVTLVKRCPQPRRCPCRIQDGAFASDW